MHYQVLISASFPSKYQMLLYSFSEKMLFFSDLLISSCIFKKFPFASPLFNNFQTLPMICRLSPEYSNEIWFIYQKLKFSFAKTTNNFVPSCCGKKFYWICKQIYVFLSNYLQRFVLLKILTNIFF